MTGGTAAPGSPGPAHGWVAHLRDGGTTPWLAWAADTTPDHDTPDRALPGAQQLELLRRINLARGSSARPRGEDDRVRTRLADRVLAAPAAGRGLADLPLVGLTASDFGPRPVDPSHLEAHELLRVASQDSNRKLAVLATEVGETGDLSLPRRPARSAPRSRDR